MDVSNANIAVIGLGYVGLPLAVEFSKYYPVIGFDINRKRVGELQHCQDITLEVEDDLLKQVTVATPPVAGSKGLFCSFEKEHIAACNVYIITVPTPVDKNNRPDLTPLYKASETVGAVLKKGDYVVYESTVYPGVTEEECVPVLEKVSGLKFNVDFYCGYSPERINPGDKLHTVAKIRKITSGSTPEAAEFVDALYSSIITAGTFKASSIKVAEAAKVIENSQRDINIAFVNELAKIFNKLGIDTKDVLEAAATKWNFLHFKPGLVGGHCIGVDPYYLAQKAQEAGYHPEIILAGRRLNDGMGEYIAHEVVKLMIRNNVVVKDAKILILGITFKENCTDVRNTRVVDIVSELNNYNTQISIYDPWAKPEDVQHEYHLSITTEMAEDERYDAIVVAVAHNEFLQTNWKQYLKPNGIIYDVKGCLNLEDVTARL
ncbi:MAG: nucleotide sugar dehydrogenase [Chitinophagia bacterium]|nr:nucleotide sugar dehydrogenase [Chitinophagia bacterium]